MSARITAADVELVTPKPLFDEMNVEAQVRGLKRTFVVDRFDGRWFCTCFRGVDCPHIRATKEAIAS